MKHRLHENGWTVIVDEQIKDLNNEQAKEIAKMTVNNMVVVFRDQELTPDQEIMFCNMIGDYQKYPAGNPRFDHVRYNNGILRVTGERDSNGEEGLFGHKAALDWHANQPSNPDRMPLIWLYGERGTEGSRTSWINNIASYEGLPESMKNKIDKIKVYCGYKSGNYSWSKFFNDHVNKNNPVSLVQVNKEGRKGIFFPFLQIFGFEGYPHEEFVEIMEYLKAHVLKEEYAYHHDWNDRDVVISEQWLSIHKRWEFEHMDKRVLHRIAFNYNRVYN